MFIKIRYIIYIKTNQINYIYNSCIGIPVLKRESRIMFLLLSSHNIFIASTSYKK